MILLRVLLRQLPANDGFRRLQPDLLKRKDIKKTTRYKYRVEK
jgi:hypothetical protein